MKKPDYYKTPLRSRKDIIDFIFDATHQRSYDYSPHPFCFNVKLYDLDLSFSKLLALYKEEDDGPHTRDEEWLEAVKERYEELGEDTIYEWGQESACRSFVGAGWGSEPDGDSYRTLWDGTEVDVRYAFVGRCGGWLSVMKFEGTDFANRSWDARELLESWDYKKLRNFYQLIVMLKHDLGNNAASREVEYQAAFNFFHNGCNDIPQPDAAQLKLFDPTGV